MLSPMISESAGQFKNRFATVQLVGHLDIDNLKFIISNWWRIRIDSGFTIMLLRHFMGNISNQSALLGLLWWADVYHWPRKKWKHGLDNASNSWPITITYIAFLFQNYSKHLIQPTPIQSLELANWLKILPTTSWRWLSYRNRWWTWLVDTKLWRKNITSNSLESRTCKSNWSWIWYRTSSKTWTAEYRRYFL